MIKHLDSLSKLSKKKAKEFLHNCHVYEKLDMFYFKLKVIAPSTYKFFKSNKEIVVEDLILNRMWIDPILDFPKILIPHEDIMKNYVGWSFGFFYLPCEKPLKTSYSKKFNQGVRYILSDVEGPSGIKNDIGVDILHILLENTKIDMLLSSKVNIDMNIVNSILEGSDKCPYSKLSSYFEAEVLSKIEGLYADDHPEGFVFKHKDYNYQLLFNERPSMNHHSKLGLELFISKFADWADWMDKNDDLMPLISYSYIDTVCSLFKAYIKDENNINFSQYHYGLSSSDLEAPTFGYYAGTGFEYIPDKETRTLCESSELCENIFKILLNGLKKPKNNTNYQYLSDLSRERWNNLVQKVTKFTISDYSSLLNK